MNGQCGWHCLFFSFDGGKGATYFWGSSRIFFSFLNTTCHLRGGTQQQTTTSIRKCEFVFLYQSSTNTNTNYPTRHQSTKAFLSLQTARRMLLRAFSHVFTNACLCWHVRCVMCICRSSHAVPTTQPMSRFLNFSPKDEQTKIKQKIPTQKTRLFKPSVSTLKLSLLTISTNANSLPFRTNLSTHTKNEQTYALSFWVWIAANLESLPLICAYSTKHLSPPTSSSVFTFVPVYQHKAIVTPCRGPKVRGRTVKTK